MPHPFCVCFRTQSTSKTCSMIERIRFLLRQQISLTTDNIHRMAGMVEKQETSALVVFLLFDFLFSYVLYHIAYWNVSVSGPARTVLLIVAKCVNNIPIICIAMTGMKWNRKTYSLRLIVILFLYMLGDVIATFSVGAAAVPYAFGHMLFLRLIYQNSYVSRWQYFCVIPLFVIAMAVLFSAGLGVIFTLGAIPYALLICLMTAASLNNPFYAPGGIVFILSDLAGLLSLPYKENWLTYCITNLIYYLAIILIALSVFVTRKKSVITIRELNHILENLQEHEVRYWLAGSWSANLTVGFQTWQFRDISIICDAESKEKFHEVLVKMLYLKPKEPFPASGKVYSVKYGTMYFKFLEHTESGPVIRSNGGKIIPLDEEMFGERKLGRNTVPCLTLGIDITDKENGIKQRSDNSDENNQLI